MYRFWEPVVKSTLLAIKPKHIVEVNYESGEMTYLLLDYCRNHDCKLTIIDPNSMIYEQELSAYDQKYELFKDLSLNRLHLLEPYEVIFLEGDHNYFTVYQELKLIEKGKDILSFPIIFIHETFKHETAWLYGKTDKNEILSAVEDFLKSTTIDLETIQINAFDGLMILVPKHKIDCISIKEELLINALEKERIENFAKYKITKQKLDKVNELHATAINELEEQISTLNREIRRLKKINTSLKRRISQVKAEIMNSFKYQFGSLLVEAIKRPYRLIVFPFRVIKLIKDHTKWKLSSGKVRPIVSSQVIVKEEVKPESVSVVVPIYNAYEEVQQCIKSVLENSDKLNKLLLINDCSTDPKIADLLEAYKNHPLVFVLNNEENMGFVKTVNRGLRETQGDVVILNSDTIVTPNWLPKLIEAAYSSYDVGTVTPLSNSAGPFSVPDPDFNELPEWLSINCMSKIVEKASVKSYIEAPTGHGFCMYIKRKLIDEIGYFDEENFAKGYCEENDFCMRALKKGWKNIIDDSTYIFHKESASFLDAEIELRETNRVKLIEKHPEYPILVKQFIESKELNLIRERVRKELSKEVPKLIPKNINN